MPRYISGFCTYYSPFLKCPPFFSQSVKYSCMSFFGFLQEGFILTVSIRSFPYYVVEFIYPPPSLLLVFFLVHGGGSTETYWRRANVNVKVYLTKPSSSLSGFIWSVSETGFISVVWLYAVMNYSWPRISVDSASWKQPTTASTNLGSKLFWIKKMCLYWTWIDFFSCYYFLNSKYLFM